MSRTRHDPRWTLAACVLASSLSFVEGSVLNVALPAIRASYGAGSADVQWVVNAYLLPLSAVARSGGLIATALLGVVLSKEGAALIPGFHLALVGAAIAAVAASATAVLMVGNVRMKS